jgi:acetylornithine deacetylase/succinyl-diaminopimelate desuccinylase-like protein
LELAVTIQQIPAPTFAEEARADFIYRRFHEEGLSDISRDGTGNVYACLPGFSPSLPIVITAHLDTVFPAGTSLETKRQADRISGPGIGDNAIGLAGLIGLLWSIRKSSTCLDNDLWLVANVGEEGLGDLRGMRAVVDRFGEKTRGYIILEGMALGQIYHRGLGVQRYLIKINTQGGHSWVNYGQPSAVHELLRVGNQLLDLALPTLPRTTLNIGVIDGGLSVNTIAPEAWVEIDLRSEDYQALVDLSTKVESIVRSSNKPGIRTHVKLIGERPVGEIPVDHPLVQLASHALKEVGIQPRYNIGSTDANVPLSRGLPAVCLGLTKGSGAHTIEEFIHTRPLSQGLHQLHLVVEGLDQLQSDNIARASMA